MIPETIACILIVIACLTLVGLYIITLKLGTADQDHGHHVSIIGSVLEFQRRMEKKRKLWLFWLCLVCWLVCIAAGVAISITRL